MGSIIPQDKEGNETHQQTPSQHAALLHSSGATKLPHVVAELAVAALLPAAGATALTPHPPAPQGRDGVAFGGPLTQRLGGPQARAGNGRGRGRWRLVP